MLGAVVLLMYLAGWLYSRHLPERWRPGAYDLVGNSHQWMHALVSVFWSLMLAAAVCAAAHVRLMSPRSLPGCSHVGVAGRCDRAAGHTDGLQGAAAEHLLECGARQ